jgi:hypothetical protein
MNESLGERIIEEDILVQEYRAEDDFFVDDRLIFSALFLHTFLLNILLYQMVYQIMVIVSGCCRSPNPMDMNLLSLDDAVEPEPSDKWFPLFETLLLFSATVASTFSLLFGASWFSLGFIVIGIGSIVNEVLSILAMFDKSRNQELYKGSLEVIFGISVLDEGQHYLIQIVQATAVILMTIIFWESLKTMYVDYLHLFNLRFLL